VSRGEKGVLISSDFVGFGAAAVEGAAPVFDLQVKRTRNADGSLSSKVVASAPMEVNSLVFNADERIATGFEPIDSDSLLQKLMSVDVKSYRLTEEWQRATGDDNTKRRGIVGQELAKVFPEHVKVVPEYKVPNQNTTFGKFYQIDKTALLIDTIAALQAQYRRFGVSAGDLNKGATVRVSSSSWRETFQKERGMETGDVTVSTGSSSSGRSGAVVISTGDSLESASGDIELSPGRSGAGVSGTTSVSGGAAVEGSRGGDVRILGGQGGDVSGSITIASGVASSSSGAIDIGTSNSTAGTAGRVSISAGQSSSDQGASVQVLAGGASKVSGTGGDLLLQSGEGAVGGSLNIRSGAGSQSGGVLKLEGGSGEESSGVSSDSTRGHGGAVTVAGGSSSRVGTGGALTLRGGDARLLQGGAIWITSGSSESGGSGAIAVRSSNSQTGSGSIAISSGDAEEGSAGDVTISAGSSGPS
jgi:hypothetical protein